jgi:hypothetical protein
MRRSFGARGSVLMISLLVVLVLAGIGLVVVQNLLNEMANVGTFRIVKQGYYLTEAGLTGPIARAAENQNVFMGVLQAKADANQKFTVTIDDVNPGFYDLSQDADGSSFGPEFARPGAAKFVTYFSDPVDSQRIPGYSTVGFCYRRYTVTADGFLGDDKVDTDDPDSVGHTASARFVSHLYLGPFQCGL